MANSELNPTWAEYQNIVTHDVEGCISEMGCQPILFVGSGLSKRYFAAPNWDELLMLLAAECPLIEKEYAYYKQKLGQDYPLIGKEFARMYQEWAWGSGKKNFPPEMFAADVPAQSYIKFAIAKILSKLTPKSLSDVKNAPMQAEIKSLQNIRPHALITTNFDQFLEKVFPDYQPVIGQNIIRGTQILTGEIFKIHGCISDFSSMVFTQEDYEEFGRKKKYLSAKLLTYFSEHPLMFIGYSASDPNIKAILSDIDECFSASNGSIIQNIYILEWRHDLPPDYSPVREKLIPIGENRSIRIKAIEASRICVGISSVLGRINLLTRSDPKMLRALLSRSYDLVRYDIPRRTVDADFEMLEGAVSSEQSFAKLFPALRLYPKDRRTTLGIRTQ